MMKKRIIAGILSLTMVLALTSCGGSSSPSPSGDGDGEKAVTLRMASVVGSTELEGRSTGMSAGLMTWIDTVEAESNGSITIDLYPDSQLASGTDAIVNGIKTGAFEVAHFTTGNWASYSNAFAELNVPYLFSSYEEAHSILEGVIGQAMKDQLEQDVSGIKPLAYISIGFRNVTSSKPVHSVADMTGLKIRTMDDALQIAAMEAMGCSVTSVPLSELYSALQTKMVDAEENPLSTIFTQKFYEVNPYICLTRHSYTSTFVFMNKDVYDSLSDAQKAAIDKANAAATAASKEAAEKADDAYMEKLTAENATIYEPTEAEFAEFKQAASSCWGKAKDIMGETRYNALMDAMGMN